MCQNQADICCVFGNKHEVMVLDEGDSYPPDFVNR